VISMYVRLSALLHISETTCSNFPKNFVDIAIGHISVWQLFHTLCTYAFMDDVIMHIVISNRWCEKGV